MLNEEALILLVAGAACALLLFGVFKLVRSSHDPVPRSRPTTSSRAIVPQTPTAGESEVGRRYAEVRAMRRDLDALRVEVQTLRGECVATVEAFGEAVDLLKQLQRTLDEIVRRAGSYAPARRADLAT